MILDIRKVKSKLRASTDTEEHPRIILVTLRYSSIADPTRCHRTFDYLFKLIYTN